jgi:hypothetical protein
MSTRRKRAAFNSVAVSVVIFLVAIVLAIAYNNASVVPAWGDYNPLPANHPAMEIAKAEKTALAEEVGIDPVGCDYGRDRDQRFLSRTESGRTRVWAKSGEEPAVMVLDIPTTEDLKLVLYSATNQLLCDSRMKTVFNTENGWKTHGEGPLQ